MCLENSIRLMRPMVVRRRQQGFLIPLALFIVIVLGFLALAISRMGVQTQLSSAQELVSTQAFYAAESGAQAGMQQLFFPDDTDRAAVGARCAAMNLSPAIDAAPGLGGCTVTVTCSCDNCAANAPTNYYTLTSVGRCGSGPTQAERSIRVASYLDRDSP